MIASRTMPDPEPIVEFRTGTPESRFTSSGNVARSERPEHRACELGGPIHERQRRRDPPCDEEAQGDRGVEVPAGDVPDG